MPNILCISHEWNLGFEALRNLADAGFVAYPAPTGIDALREFAARPISAILVNPTLPDIPVAELIDFFKSHDPNLAVIMISNSMPLAARPAGVDSVMSRHHAADLLVPTLQLLLPEQPCAAHASEEALPRAA